MSHNDHLANAAAVRIEEWQKEADWLAQQARQLQTLADAARERRDSLLRNIAAERNAFGPHNGR